MTRSGNAPDKSVLLILEPVTTTFCNFTTSSSPLDELDSDESEDESPVSDSATTSGSDSTTSSPGLSAIT